MRFFAFYGSSSPFNIVTIEIDPIKLFFLNIWEQGEKENWMKMIGYIEKGEKREVITER
jgi:hypothetical protein